MKIGDQQWDEWFAAPVTDTVSAESELAGIVSCMNVRNFKDKKRISSNRLWVYRRFGRLWPYTGWSGELELPDMLKVAPRKAVLDLTPSLYRRICAKPRCNGFIRWAWARGVFGCTGNIYNPKRGYYLIMRFHSESVARSMQDLLEGTMLTCSTREKNEVIEITIRDLQHLVRFCYFIGLGQVAQQLQERSLVRSGRDLANKQANCDSANIRRSVLTSRKHTAFINYLLEHDPEIIPDSQIPLVRARLKYPEATLSELGDILRPQVSKSTVKYRLKKLENLAESLGFKHQPHNKKRK